MHWARPKGDSNEKTGLHKFTVTIWEKSHFSQDIYFGIGLCV